MKNDVFENLCLQDRAFWLAGNMLCDDCCEHTPKLRCGEKMVVLVKTGDIYAVIYNYRDSTVDDNKLSTIGFNSIKALYNYLLNNCADWRISDAA